MSSCPNEAKDLEKLKKEFDALVKQRGEASYSTIKTRLTNFSWSVILDPDQLTAIETSMGINRKELVIRALKEVATYFEDIESPKAD